MLSHSALWVLYWHLRYILEVCFVFGFFTMLCFVLEAEVHFYLHFLFYLLMENPYFMIFFFIFIGLLSYSQRIIIIVFFWFVCLVQFFFFQLYSLAFGNQSYPSIIIGIYVRDDLHPNLLICMNFLLILIFHEFICYLSLMVFFVLLIFLQQRSLEERPKSYYSSFYQQICLSIFKFHNLYQIQNFWIVHSRHQQN